MFIKFIFLAQEESVNLCGNITNRTSISDTWNSSEIDDFRQGSGNEFSRDNSVPIDWIRRLLTDDTIENSRLIR